MTDGAAPAAPRDRSVWILGNAHHGADRSIGWGDDPFPNLSDPDTLIVDLTTLTGRVLGRIRGEKLEQAQTFIRDKILNRGTVVVITQPFLMADRGGDTAGNTSRPIPPHCLDNPKICSNYQIFPTRLATRKVPKGKAIVVDPGHDFKEYMNGVTNFFFYIERHSPEAVSKLEHTSSSTVVLREIEGQRITDNSGHNLGLTLAAGVVDYRGSHHSLEDSGRLIFLPPPSGPIDVAIEKILSACGKTVSYSEKPPAWAECLSLGKANAYLKEIEKLKDDKTKMEKKIKKLEKQRSEILDHCRLLYSDGPELEDAVVEAFRALGFDDIERMGSADEEDASFVMGGSGTRYSRCAIEAKGTRKGTQMQHILQCSKWAGQRAAAEGQPAKGVFVPNQHRLEPYPESQEIRTMIEDNQREQAELDDVCIIPSCALYEAVARVLDGEAPDRAGIASKIADARGVLEDVL